MCLEAKMQEVHQDGLEQKQQLAAYVLEALKQSYGTPDVHKS